MNAMNHINLSKTFIVNHGACELNRANGGPFYETQNLSCFEIIKIGMANCHEQESFVSSIRQGNFKFTQVEIYDALKAKLDELKASPELQEADPVVNHLIPEMTTPKQKTKAEQVAFVIGSLDLFFSHIKRSRMDDR